MARNIIQTFTALAEQIYAAIPDPASHEWTKAEINALSALVEINSRDQRPLAILSNALGSMPEAKRLAMIGEYGVPSRVLDAIANPPAWPEPIEAQGTVGVDVAILRRRAQGQLERAHADFLRAMTGNATIEERDTWKPKEDAGRAYIAGTASDEQINMIETEAAGDNTAPETLATRIVARANASYVVIGIAGRIKSGAQAALDAEVEAEEPNFAEILTTASQEFAEAAARIVARANAE